MTGPAKRLAVVVSHPIQYSVPLYQRLARRDDVKVKVFFTWHAGTEPVEDRGFRRQVAWDIPLTEGYEFELVDNISSDPGTHRFLGLRNPSLMNRIMEWHPDLVLVTGWAWLSHLLVMRQLRKHGIPILFRGDSHLLDSRLSGPRWWMKRAHLRRVFSWPAGFLVVGMANRFYFETFGVEPARLFPCPHSIDVARFAEPAEVLEQQAACLRQELGIASSQKVILYAGKFEPRKRPVELMRAVQQLDDPSLVLVLAGGGELQAEIDAIAAADSGCFRVLPFQNQSQMMIAYRLADLFVLPSAHGESWGLAVNEALACSRPVLVSDRVGCAADVIHPSCGRTFPWNDMSRLAAAIDDMLNNEDNQAMRHAASTRAWSFDTAVAESALLAAIKSVCAR